MLMLLLISFTNYKTELKFTKKLLIKLKLINKLKINI